ncbi:MAG: FG-GAP repeat domain-containing protein [Gemmatimonadales bacterium]
MLPARILTALLAGSPPPAADTLLVPRFEAALLLDQHPDTSANASIGDVDGDGHLDIVLAKGRHWPGRDRVFLGDGRGGVRRSYPVGRIADRTYTSGLADLDGDGDLDLVVSNDRPDPKRIYLSDGKGAFTLAGTVGDSTWPTRNAAIADLDGDGLPDVVLANRYGPRPGGNFLCRNLGGGRFASPCLRITDYSATTITAADFDGDGRLDLAVPHRDGGQSRVVLQNAAGGFADPRTVPFGPADGTIRMAEAGDFDGDGRLDLVTIDERIGARMYPGLAGGGFGPGRPLGDPGLSPYALKVADVNADGRPDILVGFIEAPSAVFLNDGATFRRVNFGDSQGTVYGFAVGDLNEDGRADIVAARSEAPSVVYLAR